MSPKGTLVNETGNFSGVGYGLLVPVGRWPPPLIKEVTVTTPAAVEWKITIEGTDAFGEVRRHEIRVDRVGIGYSMARSGYRSMTARRLWRPFKPRS